MSGAVADLEAGLQAMLTLKPPGVSGTRINSITALCTTNVQSESVLVQKLYTHFKKAPATHKLGVLYVVDSVTRKWTEQAKSAGQPINSAAQDGTFAAGVHRVKELLPVLMNDIIQTSPNDQKDKIRKLVDIWEKGQTFPLQMLTSFKEKLNVADSQNQSTTPPGSPPSDVRSSLGLQQNGSLPTPLPAVTPNTSSILEALANMARQTGQNGPTPSVSNQQENQYSMPHGQSNPPHQVANRLQFPPFPPPVNVPPPVATFAQQQHHQGGINGVQPPANNQSAPFAAPAPVVPSPFDALDPAAKQQLLMIQALAAQGYSPDKIAIIITAMGSQGLPPPPQIGAGGVPPPPVQFAQSQNQNSQNGWAARPEESRDRSGLGSESVRSPQSRYERRSRSRSPVNTWNARDSPASHRRGDQEFDFGDRNPGGDRGRGRGGRGGMDEYRQRSPDRRRSPTPPRANGNIKKWIGHDNSIPKGSIKVMSRTLFVGGVTTSEQELRNLFEQYGRVQTCIVNKEKRHAFVKMVSRQDAVAAKEAMESNRAPDSQLRTRWGVGFGPRDCSDYQSGISIIPIGKLTDADRKWMLTAEYGGSGGQPIESGMVVEEPDIEIGQGVSSKAISRRMQTDRGGNNGPKSSRDREEEDQPSRFRRPEREDRRDNDRQDRFSMVSGPPSMPSVPPFSMPGFPFSSLPTLPNGLPMFPPGFVFSGQNSGPPAQPPPPGRS